jgi:hypothetical protein
MSIVATPDIQESGVCSCGRICTCQASATLISVFLHLQQHSLSVADAGAEPRIVPAAPSHRMQAEASTEALASQVACHSSTLSIAVAAAAFLYWCIRHITMLSCCVHNFALWPCRQMMQLQWQPSLKTLERLPRAAHPRRPTPPLRSVLGARYAFSEFASSQLSSDSIFCHYLSVIGVRATSRSAT